MGGGGDGGDPLRMKPSISGTVMLNDDRRSSVSHDINATDDHL